MGPVFIQKSLNMGQLLWLSPYFRVRMTKTPKIVKFLKIGPSFQKKKTLKMGTLFCQNHP